MTGRMYVPIGYMRSGDVPEKEEGLIEKLDSKTGEWVVGGRSCSAPDEGKVMKPI